MKTLNIIGAGNVGKVFAQLFGRHGIFQIQDVLNQSMESAAQAVEWIGFGHPVAQLDQMRPADVTMLSVPDDEVMAVSDAWVACGLAQAGAVMVLFPSMR